MEKITFMVENSREADLLIAIAEKLGINRFSIRKKTAESKKGTKKKLLEVVKLGVDVSNFGNPSDWQRKARKDRSITLEP